jgi:hypothetical protein
VRGYRARRAAQRAQALARDRLRAVAVGVRTDVQSQVRANVQRSRRVGW